MKKGLSIGLIVVLGAVLIFGGWLRGVYNDIIREDQDVNAKWAQVQNVYQRRADLVPNLVATVKGYAAHERQVLEEVTASRSKAGSIQVTPQVLEDPAAFQRFQQAQASLSSALSRLLLVVERYPDLKANQNFLELQAQLEGTENRIAVERRRFNESAQAYNTRIKQFPAKVAAGFFGFNPKQYFQATPGAETAPRVTFE